MCGPAKFFAHAVGLVGWLFMSALSISVVMGLIEWVDVLSVAIMALVLILLGLTIRIGLAERARERDQ